MIEEWKTIEKRAVFRNNFIGLRNDLVQKPDKEIVEFVVVEQKNFVATLCVTIDGQILLIKQYRYPWLQSSIEIPAGLIEDNENPQISAIREVKEETGYKVQSIQPLLKYHPVAYSNGWGYIFFAEVEEAGSQELDPNEFIEVEKYSKNEVEEMINQGKIFHGSTILAWFAAKERGLLMNLNWSK
ncbi:MAG: NUDIX hydrolase [Candidatus Heimdallarchaeaceae archaeon]